MKVLSILLNNKALAAILVLAIVCAVFITKTENLRQEKSHLNFRVQQFRKDSITFQVRDSVFRNTIREMNKDLRVMDQMLDDCKGKGLKKELPGIDQLKRKKITHV